MRALRAGRMWQHRSGSACTAVVAADLPYAWELCVMELSRAYSPLADAQSIMEPPTAGSRLGHRSGKMLLPHRPLAPHPCPHQIASNEHLCSVQPDAH